jgi:hypothetical protein
MKFALNPGQAPDRETPIGAPQSRCEKQWSPPDHLRHELKRKDRVVIRNLRVGHRLAKGVAGHWKLWGQLAKIDASRTALHSQTTLTADTSVVRPLWWRASGGGARDFLP